MKTFKIVLILLTALALIVWARASSDDFGHIARILPFSGGFRPSIYDAAAIAMILICLGGLARLKRRDRSSDSTDDSEPY